MSSEVLIAILSFAGTVAGSLFGVLTSARLTNYKIEELQKKVEKHNHLVERTTIVERDLKTAFRCIDEIKADLK